MKHSAPHFESNKRPASSGFTLIELLTVIAIIAVLAAILIPTIGAVRQKAGTAETVSNLRQLYGYFELYATDHNGLWPAPVAPGNKEWSRDALYPYYSGGVRAVDYDDLAGTVFTSPNAANPGERASGYPDVIDASNQGFGMNAMLPSSDGAPYTGGANPQTRAPRPNLDGNRSRQMLLMDCNARFALGISGFVPQFTSYVEARHDGRNAVLFCDGHVEMIDQARFDTSHPEPLLPWFAQGTDAGYFWQGF
jgi:prepilin-type N-terminal cleavage/methylation domain-containing protein/prepilin-type processing-associated H-X9-DG protein